MKPIWRAPENSYKFGTGLIAAGVSAVGTSVAASMPLLAAVGWLLIVGGGMAILVGWYRSWPICLGVALEEGGRLGEHRVPPWSAASPGPEEGQTWCAVCRIIAWSGKPPHH